MKIADNAELPADLVSEFREAAELFREHADESVARTYERCAQLLEDALSEQEETPLALQEAAEESGYSVRHLRRLMLDGAIPNARPGADPRILREHLPRKPGHRIAPPPRQDASALRCPRQARTIGSLRSPRRSAVSRCDRGS